MIRFSVFIPVYVIAVALIETPATNVLLEMPGDIVGCVMLSLWGWWDGIAE
jgi:hypothetical protein